jgi:cell division protein ZapE
VKTFYNQLIDSGKIKPDAAQAELAEKLDALKNDITAYCQPKKFLRKAAAKPMGMFIYGKVGRGKSMMMDGFFKSLEIAEKKRVHFHEFMQGVHAKLHAERSKVEGQSANIVEEVARDYARNLKILCFDEFEVNDVTDAMILSKLFKAMSEIGVVFVITSNKPPLEHYKEGLQRESYVQFCEYLQSVVNIFSLNSKRDYRLVQVAEAENYFVPNNYENTQRLKEKFKAMSAENLHKMKLDVKGRVLNIRGAAKIAFADFRELCGANLGNADYLTIAHRFNVLFLENIPKLSEELRNEARRFINMIDILYENKVILIATAEAEPEELYIHGVSGAFEFNRTVSRLKEMRGWKHKRESEERF